MINDTVIHGTELLNITHLPEDHHDYPTHLINQLDSKDIILICCFVVIFFVGVFGNLLVCYIFLMRNTRALTTMELLIVMLAAADLIASIFNPFMFIYWTVTFHKAWHFGDFGCKVLPSLTRITVTVSFGIIFIITIDRCVVICFPFRRNMKRNEVLMSVMGAIIFAIASELSYTIHIEVNPMSTCQVPNSEMPGFVYPYLVFRILRDVVFLLIFTITVTLIYKNLYDKEVLSTMKEQRVVKKTKKIVIMLIIMAVVFILLVYPRDIFHIVFNISWLGSSGIPYTKTVLDLNSFLKVLHMCNSICNVFIYARLHGKFRRRVLGLFKQIFNAGSYPQHSFTNDASVLEERTIISLTSWQHTHLCQELLRMRNHNPRETVFTEKSILLQNEQVFTITRSSRFRLYKKLTKKAERRLMASKETVL